MRWWDQDEIIMLATLSRYFLMQYGAKIIRTMKVALSPWVLMNRLFVIGEPSELMQYLFLPWILHNMTKGYCGRRGSV